MSTSAPLTEIEAFSAELKGMTLRELREALTIHTEEIRQQESPDSEFAKQNFQFARMIRNEINSRPMGY
jgi:hypothetical protein